MELRTLKYFLTVAREESITKAAEALHMTQPPLSRQLKDLEDELGKTLFIRGSKRITLTDEGMILRKRAEEMLQLMEKTKSEISSDDESVSGTVCIGGGETDGMRIIASAIEKVQAAHPDIIFNIYSGNSEDVIEKLDNGLLEFGLLIGAEKSDKYEYLNLPVKDTWGLLMRKDHPLAKKSAIPSADIKGLPLLVSRQLTSTGRLAGIKLKDLKVVATYNLLFNASLLVEEGVGCALCLDKIIHDNEKLCFRPLEPRIETSMSLVWKKYRVMSKSCEAFLKEVKSKIKSR